MKRQKTGIVTEKSGGLIVLSPLFAMINWVLTKDSLVDNDWKVRQHAAYLIKFIIDLGHNNLEYFVVNDADIVATKKVSIKDIASAVFP